ELLPLETERTNAPIIANVVVFMPPAHEPGEPPINIKNITIRSEENGKLPISTLLNPAVLDDIDWNSAPLIISDPVVSLLVRSVADSIIAPPTSKSKLILMAMRECRLIKVVE